MWSLILIAGASVPYLFFFFNDTATTEIYTLSLHDALPIYSLATDPGLRRRGAARALLADAERRARDVGDRKSTRLNSSHGYISYAVFCLKKKKTLFTRTHSEPLKASVKAFVFGT